MKCLICNTNTASVSLNNIKQNYSCICYSCYRNDANTYKYLEEVLKNHLKGEEQMSELKFPTDEDYPDGYSWFAYDQNGHGWFYQEEPEELDSAWDSDYHTSMKKATKFVHETPIENWNTTLRQKGQAKSELKFPTDEQYPIGYNWFAYDHHGHGWFYQVEPVNLVIGWGSNDLTSLTKATQFVNKSPIRDWGFTLRNKHHSNVHGVKNDESKTNYLQVLNKDFLPTIEECSIILEQGSQKYSQDNWKSLDPERLKKALLRHLVAYLSAEIEDKESGQKHLSHVITNCLFLNWFENQKD